MNDIPPTPPDWIAIMAAGGLGMLGRLYAISRADKRPLGWALAWELLIGIPLGIIGWGTGEMLHLQGAALPAWTVLVAIAGTRGVDAAIDAVIERIRSGR